MFVKGKSYNRRELHNRYGGQEQTGISTPAEYPMIFLFTSLKGEKYGYHDGWTKEGVFLFFGEGRFGNMRFTRGNKALRDHIQDGKDVFLFEYIDPGVVRFVDQMLYVGYELRAAQDINNNLRTTIIFELVSLEAFEPDVHDYDAYERDFKNLSMAQLRKMAVEESKHPKPPDESSHAANYRSAAVRSYILRRADGQCEACERPAPFNTPADLPYLELHYLRSPSDGGPDHPEWVAGLCPNCHRQAHYGADRQEFNQQLREIILGKENLLGFRKE
jgi:5-methylcytosine-specific restriction protein A